MSTWRIRPATPTDCAAIMRIEESVFVNDAWSAATMQQELLSPHNHYIVADTTDDADALSGYAGLRHLARATDADIQTIAVVPDARGQGLGRRLMRRLLARAKAEGAREVFLDVRADNPPAKGLYASLGFTVIGVREHYYQPDDVDAEVMRLHLDEIDAQFEDE